MRIHGTFAALAAAALTLTAAGAAGTRTAHADRCSWNIVAAPNTGRVNNAGPVQALSKNDVRFGQSLFAADLVAPWQLRWDGRSIREADQLARIADTSLRLRSMSFDSADSGWMLLDSQTGPRRLGQGVRRQDGRWVLAPLAASPDPKNIGLWPGAVESIAPDDAWAVGSYYKAGKGSRPGFGSIGALIERWDGTRWRTVPHPADSRTDAFLNQVTALSPTDVWAIGTHHVGENIAPLIMHWDGAEWSEVPVPTWNGHALLSAISGTGPRDVWAVGAKAPEGDESSSVPMVVHWDGTSWTEVTGLPDLGDTQLTTVYAAGRNQVWATVEDSTGAVDHFLHFDGRTWRAVVVPGTRAINLRHEYGGIDGTGPDDIWASGTVVHQISTQKTAQIAHYSCGRGQS
ncbi:hypothetical protein LUW74_28890 [Actinomadura madurae]|uniref:hypothetical protein n=1 Tax=Actinomadura madurae TaxID=1993 RepID=UPI002026CA53|nr:hypothetical protein [Actinomadura madurae]URN06940.1 hypothetical protein LUW74_28890 [Actinomadura madurae]